MPPWNHLHPALVHFPIALLLVSPLLVLAGLLWPAQRLGIHFGALVALVLGEAGALAALVTGEAATALASTTPELRLALAAHERAAQWATGIFGALTVAFCLLWAWSLAAPRGRVRIPVLMAIWLALSLAGMAELIQAGHLGGHMVHDLGTHPRPPQGPTKEHP